ncbi:MAG: dienelactone hydrolase family protein [Ilumatobacteraceae bacterium]|nr:dienelactone hydrolase family protein [Ilumatobacteraceae bacterium]
MKNAATTAGWKYGSFTAGSSTHDTYRKGSGPGVVIVHEIPGITPAVMKFAEEIVGAGFTVVMPLLVGEVGRAPDKKYMSASMIKVCISREFSTMAMHKTSPIIDWLRALAKQLHREVGGRGVGAVGMCFSGGFALGMMLDDVMIAPVLSQPSLPFGFGKARAGDLNLSPDDEIVVQRRAVEGCQVLGLRFTGDRLVGTRFESLRKLLGEQFIAVEFPSSAKSDHSVLTEQRQDEGVRRVVDFLREKLQP